jgi:protein-S-isoprenylcysteine O-methyltransferase Ste14
MSKKSLILVIIQFSCFLFFGLTRNLFAANFLLIFQLIGLGIGVWGILVMKLGNFNIQPEVKNTANFITSGPYKIIRNPMYTGLILFFGLSTINHFSYLRFAIFVLLCIALVLKITMEEQFLAERFKTDYINYKQNTYRLIPYVY